MPEGKNVLAGNIPAGQVGGERRLFPTLPLLLPAYFLVAVFGC